MANSPLERGRWLARGLSRGLDLIFPPSCPCCFTPIESSAAGLLCANCRKEFIAPAPACPRCGSSGMAAAALGCVRCQDERLHFSAVLRLGTYDGLLRSAVLRLKKPTERALAITMGELLAEARRDEIVALAADAVVPVPMHWSRRMWRGANSPQTIAEQLSRRLDLPVAAHLLARRRRTVPQAILSPRRRAANVRGAFRARPHADLAGARLLLVDDIMTTGATVNEAAKTLCRAGAASVAIVVLARAEGLG